MKPRWRRKDRQGRLAEDRQTVHVGQEREGRRTGVSLEAAGRNSQSGQGADAGCAIDSTARRACHWKAGGTRPSCSPNLGAAPGPRDVAWEQAGRRPSTARRAPRSLANRKPAHQGRKAAAISTLIRGPSRGRSKYIGVDTQFFASAIQPQPIAGKPDQSIKFRSAYAEPCRM